ncbi:hypothetical protein ALC62_08049 [Cyphomyrmex costatus]|uniref:Uncharacterized protein n=1 Tax=Cyphomyrmex costatus TaxID=456900 RepID=A0A195CKF7_9HYME|nr:hypothetical protein ALC62_08049 [Cyphomyrmex costatus]
MSTRLPDHTYIFSTCGSCLARSIRTTSYSEFPLTDVFGKLIEQPFQETDTGKHQSSVAVNAAHAYTMREEDGMSE